MAGQADNPINGPKSHRTRGPDGEVQSRPNAQTYRNTAQLRGGIQRTHWAISPPPVPAVPPEGPGTGGMAERTRSHIPRSNLESDIQVQSKHPNIMRSTRLLSKSKPEGRRQKAREFSRRRANPEAAHKRPPSTGARILPPNTRPPPSRRPNSEAADKRPPGRAVSERISGTREDSHPRHPTPHQPSPFAGRGGEKKPPAR